MTNAALGQPPRDLAWGTEQHGFVAALTADAAEFGGNEPILVRYWLKNVSQSPQAVEHCGFWPNHKFEVVDADGRPLPLASEGREKLAAFSPDGPRRKSFTVMLDVGQVDAAFGPYDLRNYFRMERRGQLTVKCLFKQGELEIWTQDLRLTVR